MRIKDGFMITQVADQYVVIATQEAAENFHGMIRLNETGKFIWECLMQGAQRDEIIAKMVKRYDAAENDVKADVDALLTKMKQEGFLIE